jgi:hypothetical protein
VLNDTAITQNKSVLALVRELDTRVKTVAYCTMKADIYMKSQTVANHYDRASNAPRLAQDEHLHRTEIETHTDLTREAAADRWWCSTTPSRTTPSTFTGQSKSIGIRH